MTQLTIPTNANLPAFVTADNGSADEFSGGIASGMPLPIMSLRGRNFRFRFQGNETATNQLTQDIILVASRPAVSKRFFNKGYTSGSTEAPDCASSDGATPDSGTDIQHTDCASCPHNQWGSRVSESGSLGKACSDYKRMVLLPLTSEGKVSLQPVVVDVPATSLKSPRTHKGAELFLREYLTALNKAGIPPQAAVTRVAFTDAEYPQIHFQFVRYAEEHEYKAAMDARDVDDVNVVLAGDAHEGLQVIHETVTTEPVPSYVQQEQPVPQQPAQEQPVPQQPAQEQPVQEQPVQQQQPPEVEGAPDDAAVMDDVNALLKSLGS